MLGVNSVSNSYRNDSWYREVFFPLVNVFTSMLVDRMEVLEYRKKI